MQPQSLRLLLCCALLGATTACTSIIDQRGNSPSPERLAEVKPGKVTKTDVASLLGSPSSTSLFGDSSWYYISAKFETFAFYQPEELERHVVRVDFDKTGMVTQVSTLTLQDGQEITPVARETPSTGKDLSILEQLLGNVGKFNKDKSSRPGSGNGM